MLPAFVAGMLVAAPAEAAAKYSVSFRSKAITISVNSDSWRGIGRKFTGRHSVKVQRGKIYNVRTLKFKA